MSKGLSPYWRNIAVATKSLKKGLDLTMRHMKSATKQREPLAPKAENYFEKADALFTVQYPKEVLPIPTIGRYKLHNEIEDCIVCDKCAKICPVNCIDIEPVRATEEIGKTSDGTSKRIYAAKFDIDMAKCCFCGLCTTVCPTECLTMTNEFDFSTFDIKEHNFAFGNMSPLEILEKKKALEDFNAKKEEERLAKAKAAPKVAKPTMPRPAGAKPMIKPKLGGAAKPKMAIKPKIQPAAEGGTPKPKPMVRPKVQVKKEGEKAPVKPVIKPKVAAKKEGEAKVRPVIKPKIPVKKEGEISAKSKPVMKPKIPIKKEGEASAKPRPVIKPKVKPKAADEGQNQESKPKARPKIPMRPKIPPRKEGED